MFEVFIVIVLAPYCLSSNNNLIQKGNFTEQQPIPLLPDNLKGKSPAKVKIIDSSETIESAQEKRENYDIEGLKSKESSSFEESPTHDARGVNFMKKIPDSLQDGTENVPQQHMMGLNIPYYPSQAYHPSMQNYQQKNLQMQYMPQQQFPQSHGAPYQRMHPENSLPFTIPYQNQEQNFPRDATDQGKLYYPPQRVLVQSRIYYIPVRSATPPQSMYTPYGMSPQMQDPRVYHMQVPDGPRNPLMYIRHQEQPYQEHPAINTAYASIRRRPEAYPLPDHQRPHLSQHNSQLNFIPHQRQLSHQQPHRSEKIRHLEHRNIPQAVLQRQHQPSLDLPSKHSEEKREPEHLAQQRYNNFQGQRPSDSRPMGHMGTPDQRLLHEQTPHYYPRQTRDVIYKDAVPNKELTSRSED